jgi:hypothetical protein
MRISKLQIRYKIKHCIVQKYNILDIYMKIISREEWQIQLISMNIISKFIDFKQASNDRIWL